MNSASRRSRKQGTQASNQHALRLKVLSLGIAAAFSMPAYAQTPAPASAAAKDEKTGPKESIEVSASRIAREGFTSPTPTTTIDAADIASKAVTNIADVLNEVPAIRPSITSTSGDSRTFAPGANYADLRGLGSIRTLVLINRERFVPEVPPFSNAITNQVDLGVIPTIAIRAADVVTGGASAAWGSDAVAGVVNLQLYRRFSGAKLDISGSTTSRSDNQSGNFSALAGTDFLDNKGHVVVAASFDKTNGIDDVFSRPWGSAAWGALPNPNTACVNCFILGSGYQYANVAPGGLITNTTLRGTAFGVGGVPYQYPFGSAVSGAFMLGGSVPNNYPSRNVYLSPPVERKTFYGNFDYEFSNSLTGRVSVNVADVDSKVLSRELLNNYTIRSGNPYLPASVQSAMTAGNISTFNLGVYHTDIGPGRLDETSGQVTKRVSFGLDWTINDRWSADAYFASGNNKVDQTFHNAINPVNAAQAVDAIRNASGQIVCRTATNGCVPFNIFGPGSASPEALAFILTDAWSKVEYKQNAAAANLRGEAFSTWAGPVSLAAGLEYRKEEHIAENDPTQVAGQIQGIAFQNFSAQMTIKEVYGETVVPLLKNVPFAKSLDFNAAYRHTKYSQSGPVDTWKYGATWKITDDLMIRGTRSRDIRAPNLTELFFPLTTTSNNTAIPGQTQPAAFATGGNPNLKPEESDALVAGFTFTPQAIRGLSLSVDFYKSDIENVIQSAASANIVSACAAGYAPACGQITRVNNIVTLVTGGFTNLSKLELKGVDMEASYSKSLASLGVAGAPGSLEIRALGTYTDKLAFQFVPGVPADNYAGQTAPGLSFRSQFFAPRFKGNLGVGYKSNTLSATFVTNYISESKVQKTLTDAQYANNTLPAHTTFDLLGSYSFGEKRRFQVYGAVKNLSDKAPPYAPNLILFIPTNPAIYDVVGRTFRLGLRYSF